MRVAVLGAGYAGLTVARRLSRTLPDAADLIVVDDSGEHLLRHELHRVIRRPGLAEDLRVPLPALLDGAEVRRARVTGVDADAGVASLDGGELPYDYAAVCLGAATAYHDLPGLEASARPIERVPDALEIRRRFLELCEEGGRAVVGGGGLTGIQVAGELAELARDRGAADRVEVALVEQAADVAPGFPDAFRRAVRAELAARGVDLRTSVVATGATEDALETDVGSLAHDLLVWAGGLRGSDALAGDRPAVPPTLRLGGGTFVVGDAARVVDRDGEIVPASAQAALREARVAATNLRRLVEADLAGGAAGFEPHLDRLAFEPVGWVVSVGDAAVALVGPTVLRGAAARAAKAAAGLGHLAEVDRLRRAMAAVGAEVGPD